ncbi:hypothetical protein CMV_026447 [Castanea mollissima]|uniref:Pentatricopeptide repeat-containing protein n=1 Tax=Castanea mollissima TaxID=60419 RepID=A0A8J4Q7V9_9ROSI|nr:hypothetical protein CMV_026447 [Castanea mollissima]
MWSSVVVARAAVSSRQGGAVWRRFYATQKVPASSSSKTQTQTESEIPVFSTKWGFPKRLFICQNPRFYSQTSTNPTDFEESSVGFVENGDSQLENSEIHGVSEQGLVGIDEIRDTQLDSIVPGDGDEIFGSSVDGSLESALDDMGLTLREEFVVKVLETPLVLGENLIRFFKWGLKKKSDREDETVKLALEMLDDFSGEAQKYAIKPFSTILHGLCRMKDVNGAKQLLSKMIAEGPPPGNAAFNSVISGYSKAGDLGEAIQIKKLMESRGLKPDAYTYTVIMSGYANDGQMEEACKLLSEAKKKHSKLTTVTYHTLIRGYCKLEEFDKALKLLAEMKDFGVQPNVDEYNKLIQSLFLKALDWETAEKLLEEMKEKGLHLNGITKGLIRAVKEMEEEELVLGS